MRRHAAVAPLVLLVAGCGDGLSKDELAAKGDAICKRVNARSAKEPDPESATDLKRLAQRTAKIKKVLTDAQEVQQEYRRLAGKIGCKECGGGV